MEDNSRNMGPRGEVTNWMLYDLIRDFKDDVNRRFDEVRMEIRQNTKAIEENRERIEENSRQIRLLVDSREQVTVRFTRVWAGASFFISVLSAMIVLAFDKAF